MMSERKRITRIFKMRGLSIQASALDALLNVLRRENRNGNRQSQNEVLLAIIDEVKERMIQGGSGINSNALQSSVVTTSLLEEVVAHLSRDSNDIADEAVQLLDAFRTPRLTFDPMRKAFSLANRDQREKWMLYGNAADKVEMFSQRYALIHQRILRQDIFQPQFITRHGLGSEAEKDEKNGNQSHTLTPVESLLGRNGRRFLLGMVVQVEEGKYYLEDHTSQVLLDFSQASLLTDGFVTENSVVLVEGEAVDGILHVHNIGSPIVETRTESIKAIGLQNTDIFHSISSLSELDKLQKQERKHGQDGMFVILSEVHLDKPLVLDKIEKLLEGFSEFSPLPIFVLMGNFTSKPLITTKAMISYFEDLATIILKFPTIANYGRFVFIPGPSDPGVTGILPREKVPNYFTTSLRSKVRHAVFASNPCRMRFFSKEIIFFRDNLVGKMRGHCLLDPREEDDISDSDGIANLSRHAIKTVLDQGHLSPLPLSASPIYWKYDHALRMYPFPDALVVGDQVKQYYENYEECDVINPGSFHEGFHFVVYRPIGESFKGKIKSDVEFSQIG